MWRYRPAEAGPSIHEIVLYLVDIEAQNYVRCRQFIVAAGSIVSLYDVVASVRGLGYIDQSTRGALDLIVRLRSVTYNLLCHVPDFVWTLAVKAADQDMTTLENWLKVEVRKIPRQIEKIQQTYTDWASANRPRKTAGRTI